MAEEDTNEDTNSEDDFMSPQDEFRVLYQQGADLAGNVKKIAMTMQQGGERGSAEALRVVAGDVIEWMLEVVAATGAHLEELVEAAAENSEGGIPVEDAMFIYRTILTNTKLWREVKSQATSSHSEIIDQQIEMNNLAMQKLVEATDDELPLMVEEEIAQATTEASDGAGTTN